MSPVRVYRFHADNGGEFVNEHMENALARLGDPDYSHGLPRNPQCQGLVERANGTLKRKTVMKCMDKGYKNSLEVFEWVPVFLECIARENTAALPLYKGLTPFLCLHLRPKNGGLHDALSADDIAEMYTFMAEAQKNKAVTKHATAYH